MGDCCYVPDIGGVTGPPLPYFKRSGMPWDLPTHIHSKCFMESVLLQHTAEPEDRMLLTLSSFMYLLLIYTAKCGFSSFS